MIDKNYLYAVMFNDNIMELYEDEVIAVNKMEFYRDWYLAAIINESDEYKEQYKQMWHVEKFKFMVDAVNRYIKGE